MNIYDSESENTGDVLSDNLSEYIQTENAMKSNFWLKCYFKMCQYFPFLDTFVCMATIKPYIFQTAF